MLVVRQHVVHKRRAAPPMPEDEERFHVHFLVAQQAVVASVLHNFQRAEDAAYAFCQRVFCFPSFFDTLPPGDCTEGFPVRANQCIYR